MKNTNQSINFTNNVWIKPVPTRVLGHWTRQFQSRSEPPWSWLGCSFEGARPGPYCVECRLRGRQVPGLGQVRGGGDTYGASRETKIERVAWFRTRFILTICWLRQAAPRTHVIQEDGRVEMGTVCGVVAGFRMLTQPWGWVLEEDQLRRHWTLTSKKTIFNFENR